MNQASSTVFHLCPHAVTASAQEHQAVKLSHDKPSRIRFGFESDTEFIGDRLIECGLIGET
ncbi:MAG: hypothetical protein WBA88_16085 [Pseudaminobacter sp.]